MNKTIRIPLRGGRVALIDAIDADLVSSYSWRMLATSTGRFYAVAQVRSGGIRQMIYMHRLIAGTPAGMSTDHVNNDGLDNRRSNLRFATQSQNLRNTGKRPQSVGRMPTSQYKGVSWDRARDKWQVSVRMNGRVVFSGRYDSETDAARAYDAAAIAASGEFAYLNFPDESAA